MNTEEIAAEAAKQIRGKVCDITGISLDPKYLWLDNIIKAAIEKARELPDERWVSEQLFAANTMLQALELENSKLRASTGE